jgi:tRNA/tmRNA/rRNA uracil-C5-methylase (TrmA/RlmC/RlmD family)
VIGSPRPFGYRSKITPHFGTPAEGREVAIGFLRQGTRFDVVDVPRCEIATEAINERLTTERAARSAASPQRAALRTDRRSCCATRAAS